MFMQIYIYIYIYGFSDHVKLLVLRIPSLAQPSFHFLPFVLHIESEYLEFLGTFPKLLSQPD